MNFKLEVIVHGAISHSFFETFEQANEQYLKIKETIGKPLYSTNSKQEVSIETPAGPVSYVVDKIVSARVIDLDQYNHSVQHRTELGVRAEVAYRMRLQSEGVADVKP